VRTHRVGGARTKRWRANIGGIIASALLPLWLTELCVTVTRTTNQSQSQDQGQSQRQRQSQIIPKSRVDPKLGGTDPFGAFELPQNTAQRTTATLTARHLGISVFQNTRMPISPRQVWMKINLSDKTLLSVT
jgi:hypothetical protein